MQFVFFDRYAFADTSYTPELVPTVEACTDANEEHSPVDLSELKHLRSLDIFARNSIQIPCEKIASVVSTLPPNVLRNLTINLRYLHKEEEEEEEDAMFAHGRDTRSGGKLTDRLDSQTSSDQVGHPLEDVILALATPSVVVFTERVKRNKLPFYSKMVQSYFPRLHEGRLLQVLDSSGAYSMCTPLFQHSVAHTFSRIFRRGGPSRS